MVLGRGGRVLARRSGADEGHQPGYPLPRRDAATGQLATDAGTGCVLVLVPAGRLDQGARRNRPGESDALAEPDELDGGSAMLDAFLIARTELTQAQWSRLSGRGAVADDPQLPVTNVDWHTATGVLARFGLSLPENRSYQTVAGLIIDVLQHLPVTGEVAQTQGWQFEIVDMDGRRIDKLLASRL